jgi:hypothetical protein
VPDCRAPICIVTPSAVTGVIAFTQDAEQIVLESGATPAWAALIGGAPFGEQLLMW